MDSYYQAKEGAQYCAFVTHTYSGGYDASPCTCSSCSGPAWRFKSPQQIQKRTQCQAIAGRDSSSVEVDWALEQPIPSSSVRGGEEDN